MGAQRISAGSLCKLGGISLNLYERWARQELVRELGTGGAEMLDVIRLAVIQELKQHLKLDEVRIVCRQVFPMFVERLPSGRVDIVVENGPKTAAVVHTDAELARAIRNGRLLRIIPVGDAIEKAREGFRLRVQDDATPQPPRRAVKRRNIEPA